MTAHTPTLVLHAWPRTYVDGAAKGRFASQSCPPTITEGQESTSVQSRSVNSTTEHTEPEEPIEQEPAAKQAH